MITLIQYKQKFNAFTNRGGVNLFVRYSPLFVYALVILTTLVKGFAGLLKAYDKLAARCFVQGNFRLHCITLQDITF